MTGHTISDRICNRWSILRSKGQVKENWNACEEWSCSCTDNSLKFSFFNTQRVPKECENNNGHLGNLGVLVIALQQEVSCYLGMDFGHQPHVFWSLREMKVRQIWRRRAVTDNLLLCLVFAY